MAEDNGPAQNNSATDQPPQPPLVEAAALSAAFVTAIRRAGLATSPDRAARLAEALHLIPPTQLGQLYWTCRVVLVSAREQVPLFDAVFAAVFRGSAGTAQPGSAARPAVQPPPGPGPRTRPAAPGSAHCRPDVQARCAVCRRAGAAAQAQRRRQLQRRSQPPHIIYFIGRKLGKGCLMQMFVRGNHG